MNAVTLKLEFANLRALQRSPLLGEHLQVGLVIPCQDPSPERALEGCVIDETAVEDPDFQARLSDPQAIVIVVAAVPDEPFIQQADRLKRAPRDEDAD